MTINRLKASLVICILNFLYIYDCLNWFIFSIEITCNTELDDDHNKLIEDDNKKWVSYFVQQQELIIQF